MFRRAFRRPRLRYNFNYLLNPANEEAITNSIKMRNERGNLGELKRVFRQTLRTTGELTDEVNQLASDIPNQLHPKWSEWSPEEQDSKEPVVLEARGVLPTDAPAGIKTAETLDIGFGTKGKWSVSRSYYLQGDMARLENALIQFVLSILREENFLLVSVPDLLRPEIIQAAGFPTEGVSNQVYKLVSDTPICLSGTAEMGIASLLVGLKIPPTFLPLKLCAVSECFRAELSDTAEGRGLYRVHDFKKAEMFCVGSDSNVLLEEHILPVQKRIFDELGLYYRVVDIAPSDLGASAMRKIDCEAWMPGRGGFGEISSASSCGDYQTRRLGLTTTTAEGAEVFLETANGTAAAIPRLIKSICENGQEETETGKMRVRVPSVLKSYFRGKSSEFLEKESGGWIQNLPPNARVK